MDDYNELKTKGPKIWTYGLGYIHIERKCRRKNEKYQRKVSLSSLLLPGVNGPLNVPKCNGT